MAKKYIEVFPRIMDEFKEMVEEDMKNYQIKGLPKGYIFYYMELEGTFRDIGMGEIIINKNMVEAKENFYLSASMRKVLFEKQNLVNYIGEDYGYRFCEEIDAIFMALLTNDNELINSLVNLSGKMGENDKVIEPFQIYIYNKLNAIKYIILNEFSKAEKFIERIREISSEKFMEPYLDNEKILTAIVEKNENMLNDTLKHLAQTQIKLKQYKGSPKEFFSLEALGLAKLAILSGMNVQLDEASAPKEMLEESDITYPLIDFVD